MRHAPLLLVLVLVAGCGVHNQKTAIRDARLAVAAVGMGVDVADGVVATVYEDTKPEDTKGYCQQKIAAFVLRQSIIVLETAADSILLWERSLAVYLARKEAGAKPTLDDVLSSQADWLKIAVVVIDIMNGAMETIEHFGVPIPQELTYAWSFLYGMTGKAVREPFEFDWGAIKQGVCVDYLPGGG